MHYVTDLHLHSKYSRAVSPQMTLSVMAAHARQKGIDILTAADFTHPVWFKEISSQLVESTEGFYKLKDDVAGAREIYFMLSTELSSIYKQGDKLRRIHNLIFVPSFETAEKLTKALVSRGCNLNADGRPIVGISSEALLDLLLSIDERAFLIPCHVWTPHFGVYGSASGFETLDEAFGSLSKYIYGIETGLSSDPDMNWQVKELMDRTILSFSDAHSAPKMLREATVFDLVEPTYENLRQGIMRLLTKSNNPNKIVYTLEFYPEEGKYHFSGHRNCKVSVGPDEIRSGGTTCPVCQRKLTEGVLYRVQELSDPALLDRVQTKENESGVKWYIDKMHIQPPYVKLVPLLEIAAESLSSTVNSQKSKDLYAKLCAQLESELHVLLRAPITDIEKIGGMKVAQGIHKIREGSINIEPGYDGEYGKVSIWEEGELREVQDVPQLKLEF
ncbi:MAG TPA: endonuclease Q family protein [Candidatus Saccharimonadales bacterium]|nr:endonuclease Q family protein [Candidatus Saccharimonadales bacterium]